MAIEPLIRSHVCELSLIEVLLAIPDDSAGSTSHILVVKHTILADLRGQPRSYCILDSSRLS